MGLTHYIFVRRDLPIGVMCAQITHAAGESGALYADPDDGRFRGAAAVVLEAKSEKHLNKIAEHLRQLDIQNVEVWETHGYYANQFMAIGIVPCNRTSALSEYQTLKSCYVDNPDEDE